MSGRGEPGRYVLKGLMMDNTTKWSINESLLQSYRGIFISSQAVIIAVGALLIHDMLMFLTVALLGLFMIWYIWYPVVRSRHLIVDYYKYASNLDPKQPEKLCTETEYVEDSDKRKEANKLLCIHKNWRPTRIKMDLLLPMMYTAIWLALVFWSLYNHCFITRNISGGLAGLSFPGNI